MITVTDTGSAIEISGHAGYAGRGQDIVCEAVSSLVQTTFASICDEIGSNGYTIAESGYAMIRTPDHAPESYHVLVRHLRRGLRMLAEAYPKYIQIEGMN